jgi:hypothetical protein
MRDRRADVRPDPFFVERVIANLPRAQDFAFAWAARRVIPVTLGLAAVLALAIFVVEKPAPTTATATAASQDPLEWLLQ